MKRTGVFLSGVFVIAILSFCLPGCPQTTDTTKEQQDNTGYSISLDKEECSIYVPIGGKYFSPPQPLMVTVTNTGEAETGSMTVVIKNDEYNLFKLSDDEIPSLAPGEKAVFAITVPQKDQGWTSKYTVEVVVGNKKTSKKMNLEYGAYYYLPVDLSITPSFSQANSAPTVTPDAGKTEVMSWFSSNSAVAVFEEGALKLVGAGEVTIGYVSGNDPFTVKGKTIKVYPEHLAPWIVSASINATAPETVQVMFNEPVNIVDKAKIRVKANGFPSGNSTTIPYLDNAGPTYRQITAVAQGGDEKTWNLTMSAPAAYGEILRLETTSSGAAENVYSVELPAIPQFIIKNTVKRTKGNFENEAGFYVDGVKQSTAANASLLRNALTAINGYSAANKLNKTWTIVLGENQTNFVPGGTFSGGAAGDWLGSTLIITSADDTDKIITNVIASSNGLTARYGLTLVIDEHIIFEGRGATSNVDQLIRVMDQAKVILDGGEIRNNTSTQTSDNAGGVRIGGGSNGAWFIMNSGKITGNTAINNSTSAASAVSPYGGGISISDWGVFIMYDGEISGNTARGTNVLIPRAGAIATPYSRGTGRYQNNAVFILGGEIKGNKVEGTATPAIASAGGILASGVFQKTGGTIKENTTEFTGDVNASQVSVILASTAGNPAADTAAMRKATAGPEIELIVEFGSAKHTIPEWAPLPGDWE